ncbi:MAG: EAL domain-containing protein [Gammaproteobacteria bacterium]|nr:EAL domain-containing protein [Gammaproteobacteria bacterium]
MAIHTITTVRFHNYWKLLQILAPCVDVCIVYNQDGHFIWQSSRKLHPQMERISVIAKAFLRQAVPAQIFSKRQKLGEDTILEMMVTYDPEINQSIGTALLINSGDEAIALTPEKRKSIELLNQSLLTEFSLIHKVIEKEQELNSITEELTHRYEELNLIYSAGDQVQNISHGRELLQNILVNAANYMDVDLVAILLPEKSVELFHKRAADVGDQQMLLGLMRNHIYMHLKIYKTPIVINRAEDAQKINILFDLPYKAIVSPMLNADNDAIGMMAIFNNNNRIDFTNSDRNLLEVLCNRATNIVLHNFDPLTGLENSHSFEMIVLETLRQTWQNESHHAVIIIDIDRMAVINDLGGLETGDKLIKRIAAVLTRSVRSYDTVARLGGDKFAILLKNSDLDSALEIMQKIDASVKQIDIEVDSEAHEVSISMGIAPITSDVQNVSSVLSNAESALHAAKARGRSQIQVFELDDSNLLKRRQQIKWVSRTQSAIREDRLIIYAQKIQPVNPEQALPHFEILIRMLDENNQVIEPEHFLPAAENFYLMPKIDRWVLNNTFKLLEQYAEEFGTSGCEVSINLSGQTISDTDFADYIAETINSYKLDPSCLCFEVTESAAVANLSDAREFINQVKSLGCKFSLDDFGTGQSSFAYLKNLPVDYLKIDGSFVNNIVDDPVSRSMVSAINQVGHAMKLHTIAEYVEDDAIFNCLKDIGVDFVQGNGIDTAQPLTKKLRQLSSSAAVTSDVG